MGSDADDAAALRILTQYRAIDDIDVAYQLSSERGAGEDNPIERIVRGFGVRDSRALVRTGKANETRLKTASELGNWELENPPSARAWRPDRSRRRGAVENDHVRCVLYVCKMRSFTARKAGRNGVGLSSFPRYGSEG